PGPARRTEGPPYTALRTAHSALRTSHYTIFTICPLLNASFAAIVQLAECDAFSGPQLSDVPQRIAFAHATISYVLGEIDSAAPEGVCARAAPPPACWGFVSDVSRSAPGPFGATSTPV